ncbi:MAG: hypothetical protein AAF721_19140 [Myxococcota bacterium]
MGKRGRAFITLLGLCSLGVACGAGDSGRDAVTGASGVPGIPPTAGSPGGDTDGDEDDDEGDDDGGDDGGISYDLGDAVDDGLGEDDECAEVTEDADVGLEGADIIVVIDNSQSMSNEIAQVQTNMNAFSMQIAGAAVDPHVIMISGFQHNSDSGICVPPPMGSGMCPTADHNPPGYWRVDNWVGSHSALARVVQHYPDYAPTLRDNASTHIVVITDDDSDWNALQFDGMFKALNPKFADYRLHSIVNNGGDVYKQLSMMTGGLTGDLSSNQFQPIFDELASDVIETATLACEYTIPEPEGGQIFNPDEVNVEFEDGMGGTLAIGRVDSEAQCAGVADGWFYDNPADPQSIVLCPSTCDSIQGFTLARVSVIFGCMTIPAG